VKAIAAIDRMFDEEERQVYDVRMQSLADVESKIASAEEKGMEKGVEIGREQGIEEGVEIGKEKGREEGILEGIVEGRVEGQSKLLKRQLELRFGALPQWAAEKLTSATEQELETWGESILSAPTLEAMFKTNTTIS
ncbi:MAG: DUF4351 domain-containing protein, partial [Chlorobium sp.]